MSRIPRSSQRLLPVLIAWFLATSTTWAVKPADELLPATTKLFISLPSVEAFRASFDRTEFGALIRDPVMQPVAEDLGKQLRDRLGQASTALGINWTDLEGVYSGEAALARIQPDGDGAKHATALLVDVTDHLLELEKVRESVDLELKKREATRSEQAVGDVQITVYELPRRVGEVQARQVLMFVAEDQFVVTNDASVAEFVIQRIQVSGDNSLKDNLAYASVMSKLTAASEGLTPHVRWYLEPFGLAEVARASRGGRRSRGKDILQILKNQGFEAVQALGGHVNLATEQHELLHRTLVYAPPVSAGPSEYLKAARMLNFPASDQLPAPDWVPRTLATYTSWNWNIREAFEYSISLIDEVVDSEGFVEDVLASFENDGPKINIRTELLDFLDERILVISDYRLPITIKSERLLAAIRVTDDQRAARALRKLWQTDPQANERELLGRVVWELVPEAEDTIPELDIAGVPLPGGDLQRDQQAESMQLPNAAMTVAHGYLLVASHIEFLEEVLPERPTHATLGDSVDFQMINQHLRKLGAGEDSLRFFSRTDEEFRGTYEMIRRGQMPESESLLGKLLNRLLGPEEKGVVRKQQLDGKSLPEYQIVRRYLGPAGLFVTPREEGWLVTGVMMSKRQLAEADAARETLKTATLDLGNPKPEARNPR